MTRLTADNFLGIYQFPVATETTDLFKKEDLQKLGLATNAHNHTAGLGLQIPTDGIVDGAITAPKLGSGAVSAAAISPGSIGTTQLADGSVTTAKIADGQVTSAKIADGSIIGADIAAGQITSAHIADGSIVGGDIAAETITGANIANGTITSSDIAAGTINNGNISSATITGDRIAAETITSNNIANGSIASADIGVGQVAGSNLAGASVDGSKVTNPLILPAANRIMWTDGGGPYIGQSGPNMALYPNVTVLGNLGCQGAGPGPFAIQLVNSPSAAGQGQANAWITYSSQDAKSNVLPMDDALSLVVNETLHGVRYDHAESGVGEVGFIAEAWAPVLPEVVYTDGTNPVGMDYSRVGVVTFEALKQYIAQTDARLAALEAKP